ncbi:hypothetical protein T07_5475 [Trichinella nelsoni]|uniref:Uncharacterized protein n=1 Tax=Trichinella nelsoni TaxID=6336 RepID=A0A0V0RVE8_9BILA|nr:hypothetical protein T07_5475 [Trichinella nelsoni]
MVSIFPKLSSCSIQAQSRIMLTMIDINIEIIFCWCNENTLLRMLSWHFRLQFDIEKSVQIIVNFYL